VAVLSAVHNVIIVLFFVLMDGEKMNDGQLVGFGVSTVGIVCYALVKHWQKVEDQKVAAIMERNRDEERGFSSSQERI